MKPPDRPDDPHPKLSSDSAFTPTMVDPEAGFEATVGVASHTMDVQPRASLPGYQLGEVIGRGGMGEVVLARDERIGRDVAIKRMRGTDADAPTRSRGSCARRGSRRGSSTRRSCRSTSSAATRDGQPYFTMKRLAGVTLAELLAATPPPPRQRLLRAFADVCLAIEFAHSRRVVHRDLKPANIMLGDFGEVYVLDWGLARVAGEAETLGRRRHRVARWHDPGRRGARHARLHGARAGARRSDVGPAADVYALGSILFEILAGEPLHPRGLRRAAVDRGRHRRPPGDAPARSRRFRPSSTRSAPRRSRSIRRRVRPRASSRAESSATSTAIAISNGAARSRSDWLAKARAALCRRRQSADASRRCRTRVAHSRSIPIRAKPPDSSRT